MGPTFKWAYGTHMPGPCWCLKISMYTPNKEKEREKERETMKALMSLSYNYVTSKLHPNHLIRQIKDEQQISS